MKKELIKVSNLPPYLFKLEDGSFIKNHTTGYTEVYDYILVSENQVVNEGYTSAQVWAIYHIHNNHVWIDNSLEPDRINLSLLQTSIEVVDIIDQKSTKSTISERDRFLQSITDWEIRLIIENRKDFHRTCEKVGISKPKILKQTIKELEEKKLLEKQFKAVIPTGMWRYINNLTESLYRKYPDFGRMLDPEEQEQY